MADDYDFEWPMNLKPRNINIKPPRDTKSASTSLTNFEQIVPVIRPPFRMELQFPTFTKREQILTYRAALALFEGRANLVRIPLFDFYSAGVIFGSGGVSHSDGSPFSDSSLYSTPDVVGVGVTAVQGAREITVNTGSYGKLLEGGQYFGIGNDCYIARGVWYNEEGTVATINASPTMRRPYTNEVFRTKPYMIARLVDDDSGEHPLDLGMYATPTLNLIEGFKSPLGALT